MTYPVIFSLMNDDELLTFFGVSFPMKSVASKRGFIRLLSGLGLVHREKILNPAESQYCLSLNDLFDSTIEPGLTIMQDIRHHTVCY